MKNVYIIAEGVSEEQFVNNILSSYFWSKEIFLHPEKVITGTSKNNKLFKGGGNSYQIYKNHLQKRIKQFASQDSYLFTTMIDLYALPTDFPRLQESKKINDAYKRIEFLESSLYSDIGYDNFIPYIQLHEFETLLFTDIDSIVNTFFEYDDLETIIKNDILYYKNVELINESAEMSPSKRLNRYTKGEYCKAKVSSSQQILQKISLEQMREKCKHFNEWLTKIEEYQV